MIDVKVVKYRRLDLESWTGLGRKRECMGSLEANIVGIFSFTLLQGGKIHELACHFSTFPADAATREFFVQTCEYRSESCYITGSSTPVRSGCMQLPCWWNVLVQLCPVLSEKGLGGGNGGGGGGVGVGRGLFSRISSCGEDETGILSALVTFGSHAEGNPVSSLTRSVMSEFHCNTAEMRFF